MRPPTRSTRSVRPSSNKTTAIASARRSRGTSSPPTPLAPSETSNATPPPNPKPQPIIAAAASADDAKVDPGTSPGWGLASAPSPPPPPPPPLAPPVIGCFPVLPPSAVFEGDESQSSLVSVGPFYNVGYSPTFLGKPSRPRHRMSSDKLEALDAFFRRNTHPPRKEKEAICKALNMDLKTVTIWFQNKRQTVARSRKLQVPEDASADASTATSTAAMDMLASASAEMTPLAITASTTTTTTAVNPSASASSSATSSVQLGSDAGRSRRLERSLSLDASSVSRRHLQRTASSRDSVPAFLPLASPCVRLSATAVRDSNVFGSAQAEPSSASPDLREPHLGRTQAGSWPIHPEDLWKHIPSSPALPALSSPDASPDIDTPSRSSKFSVQRPRTLEWACARSAKRRRTNPDHEPIHYEDGETDSECNFMDRSDTCHPSFSISEARVPLEYYDEYPLDVVRGAVLLLGLRDTTRGLAL